MQKLYTVCFFLFSIAGFVTAQSRISGQITDEQGSPLPSANVILLNASDSVLIKGWVADVDGKFSLEQIAPGNYLLVSSMVGFTKTYQSLRVAAQENRNLGSIVLMEDASVLNDVVVTAEKPMFEQRIDRLVVNVENSITAAGGTVLEVLERSPGITVNRQAGSVSMGGKQGVLVMINGKIQRIPMSSLIQMLGGMSANSVEKIELINNPSAKYDAQGDAGIINIVSKQNMGYGTNGSFTGTFGYGFTMKSSGSLDFNHRNKNFNIFGGYSVVYNKVWSRWEFYRSIENPSQQTATTTRRIASTPIHQARIGAEWNLSKKTSMSALISGYDDKWKMDARNTSHVVQSGLDSARIKLKDIELNHWKNLMGNLNINHLFREGHALNIDADYLYYNDNNPHNYTNDYDFIQSNTERTDLINISKKTPINMGVIKIDYEVPIAKLKLENGVKGTYSRLKNQVLVENFESGEWVSDDSFTQDYDMKDDVIAAYSTLSGSLSPKAKFQLGLRTEHTDMEIQNDENETVFDLNFWSLFPSAFYSYQFNNDNAINFSYGRRITRPSYQDIAPFVIFMDPFTFFSGNPKLKPTLTDGYQVSVTHKELLISVKYSQDKNYIANFQTRVDPVDKKTYFYSANLDKVQTVSTVMSFPVKLAKWCKIQNNFTGLFQTITTQYEGVAVSIQQISGQLNSTIGFTLPRNFSAEISGLYWTPSRFGITKIKSFGDMSVGLQKKLTNGSFSLNISDIFWTNIITATVKNESINLNTRARFMFSEPRTVRLTYSRNFGNSTVKSSRSRSTASQDEQRRVK